MCWQPRINITPGSVTVVSSHNWLLFVCYKKIEVCNIMSVCMCVSSLEILEQVSSRGNESGFYSGGTCSNLSTINWPLLAVCSSPSKRRPGCHPQIRHHLYIPPPAFVLHNYLIYRQIVAAVDTLLLNDEQSSELPLKLYTFHVTWCCNL